MRVILLTLSISAGCGGPSSSASSPGEAEARALVAEALEAWKGGSAPDALNRRSPALRFVDPDLASGMKLTAFEIGDQGNSYEYVCDVSVLLTLSDRRGRPVSRQVVYQVATEPGPAVLRNDPD